MSEVIMVKTPGLYRWEEKDVNMPGEQVVGMYQPGSPAITEFDYQPTGEESEESLLLGDAAADRFVDFYARCRAAAPDERPYYDGHILAYYISNAVQLQQEPPEGHLLSLPSTPVNVYQLEAGKPYAVEAAGQQLDHSVIGTERPDHNVSILGHQASLVVTRNTDIMSMYNGVAMRRLYPLPGPCLHSLVS